jgi:hypothetical protein
LGISTKMKGFFLSAELKETSFFWEFKESNNIKPFVFTQYSIFGKKTDKKSFEDVKDLQSLIKSFSRNDPNNPKKND